jgi:hypothetical protein
MQSVHIATKVVSSWPGVLDTTLRDKVCQWLATGRWYSQGTPVSSTNEPVSPGIAVSCTNKTDSQDIKWNILKHSNSHNLVFFFRVGVCISEQEDAMINKGNNKITELHILAVSFIGAWNRNTWRKSLPYNNRLKNKNYPTVGTVPKKNLI